MIEIILILLIIYELYKFLHDGQFEGFSASKTNIIYSNYTNDSNAQQYAKVNEEIIVLEQKPASDRNIKFKYFRGPLNKYMAIYVRKVIPGESGEMRINTILVQITELNYDILQLLGNNKALFNDMTSTIKYYIKVLDDVSYRFELDRYNQRQDIMNKYNNCVTKLSTTSSRNAAINTCNEQFKGFLNKL